MFKKFRVIAVVALAAFALTVSVSGLVAADDKVPSVSEIMKKGHSKTGIISKVRSATKSENWETATKAATELKSLGEALGKNKPEKGDDASWKKLSDKYAANTAAVAAGAEKKDAAAVNAALGKIGTSCKECHDAHK